MKEQPNRDLKSLRWAINLVANATNRILASTMRSVNGTRVIAIRHSGRTFLELPEKPLFQLINTFVGCLLRLEPLG